MKNKIFWWELCGFVFVCVVGTLLHFLYDFLPLTILAPICALNESTWEHMKILFMPCFFFALIQSFSLLKRIKGFFLFKFIASLFATLLIPVLFYTYNGAIGKSPFYIDILIFYIAAALNSILSFYALNRPLKSKKSSVYGLIGLLLIFLAFVVFSFYPPDLPIFIDPLNS